MTDQRWGPRLIYFMIVFGSLFTIIQFSHYTMSHLWWWVTGISLGCAFAAEWSAQRGAKVGAAMLTGASVTERRPDPPLSKARSLIEREQFDDALVELDLVWASFPGRPEVVACYERVMLDRMAGPSGFAAFLEGALSRMEPVDKPYAYLRLAELHADRIGNKETAFLWTSRLLAEFPDSRHVAAARALRESLKPKEG